MYSFSVAESFPVHTSVGVVVADTPRMHTMSFNVTHGLFDVKMYNGVCYILVYMSWSKLSIRSHF